MASQHADLAVDGFLELEARFSAFVRAVPPSSEHSRVHSPVLASILLDACSLIETVLKSTMDSQRYNNIANIQQHRARRYAQAPPFLNINDLRAVFRPDSLYAKPVWFLPRGESSFPWYVWRNQAGNPRWWSAYNDVKHSRFDNARRATLGTTMHAVKALFLTVVQSLDFRGRLVERGFVRCSGTSAQHLTTSAASWEPLPMQQQAPVVAVSALFGYKFLSHGSPARANSISVFT